MTVGVLLFHNIFVENAYTLSKSMNMDIITNFEPKEDDVYYIWGAHLKSSFLYQAQLKHKIKYILFQTEQINSKFFKDKFYLKLLQNTDNIVLSWSPYLASLLEKRFNIHNNGLFDFTFITQPYNNDRNIDFFFTGSWTPSRDEIFKTIKKICEENNMLFICDFNWSFEDNNKLTSILVRTKYVLNVPYYSDNALELHRINKALLCGCQVLSEHSSDDDLNEKYGKYIHIGNIRKMVRNLNKLQKKEKFKYDYIIKYNAKI